MPDDECNKTIFENIATTSFRRKGFDILRLFIVLNKGIKEDFKQLF